MKNLLVLCICLMLFITCKKVTNLTENEEYNSEQFSFKKAKKNKVDICHKGKILNVSVNSLSSHQRHGDAVDMDGDGFFDKNNECSKIDCDDDSYSISNSCVPQIGDFFQEGIVFYIAPNPVDLDGNGTLDIGLVCAIKDQSARIPWNNGSFIATSATGIVIGSGSLNTNAIIAAQGPIETNYAAGLAKAYTVGGFNDWFLPSKDELNQMFINKATIDTAAISNGGNAFANRAYWSSSDTFNPSFAWFQWFNNGSQSSTNKFAGINARAIHAF